MRILVTGGAGFVGSHLTDKLIELGHYVEVWDNFTTGRHSNVNKAAFLVDHDIAEPLTVEGFDVIAHCAASYSDRNNWERDTRTNVLGTVNLVKSAQEHGVPRIVYFQTALCYGHRPRMPVGTLRPISLPTSQPIAPDNSYAITKTAGEQFIQHSGISYVSLRLANIYGPRNVSGPIPTFFKRITEGKSCTVVDSRRDYVYIDDALEVAVAAVLGKGEGVYHLASGSDYAISEAFDAVVNAMGATGVGARYIDREPGDAGSILLDPSRAEAEFGWKASTPFAEGIANAVAWYQEHGVEQTFTHLAYAD